MSMKQLRDILSEYRSWNGSRAELMALIEKIEQEDPATRMLQSKKAPYDRLPVNARRIQWFISNGIMPKPEGHNYDYSHLVFYWAAIILRKKHKLQFSQIADFAYKLGQKTAEEIVFHGAHSGFLEKIQFNQEDNFSEQHLSDHLKSMGRREGRALVSRPLRLAITPGCEVILSESQLSGLKADDVEALAYALRSSLMQFVKSGHRSSENE